MNKKNKYISVFFGLIFSIILFSVAKTTLADNSTQNLIQNPSLETPSQSSPDTPEGWYSDSFGNNSVSFSYPVPGISGGNAASVDMTAHTSGDAKWFFNPVQVTPGKNYTFTDMYKSSVSSVVTVQYAMADESLNNINLGVAPRSTDWTEFSATFTAPADAVTATVLHRIRKVGTLTVDQFSLVDPVDATSSDTTTDSSGTTTPVIPTTDPNPSTDPSTLGPNLIMNPSLQESTDGLPNNWYTDIEGNNDAVFNYPVAGRTDGQAVQTTISSFTDGDAKWFFEPVLVQSNADYQFSEYYKSNVKTVLTAGFTMADGTRRYTNIVTLPPASDWTLVQKTINMPPDAVKMTMLHVLRSAGTLTVDDVSLNKLPAATFTEGMVTLSFDDTDLSFFINALPLLKSHNMTATENVVTSWIGQDQKMTVAQLQQIKNAGMDIEAHSITHPFLTTLSQSDIATEISGSRNTLESLGLGPISTFAYPFGEYDDNIESLVKSNGLLAARGTNVGFNTKNSDIYALRTQNVVNDTSIDQIKTWIDEAKQDHTWLILGLHEVSNNNPTDTYTITPATLQSILDYLQQTNTKVVTTDYVVRNLMK